MLLFAEALSSSSSSYQFVTAMVVSPPLALKRCIHHLVKIWSAGHGHDETHKKQRRKEEMKKVVVHAGYHCFTIDCPLVG